PIAPARLYGVGRLLAWCGVRGPPGAFGAVRLRARDRGMRLGRFSASGTGLDRARRLARVAALGLAPLLAGCWLRPDPPDLNVDVPDSYVTARKGPDSRLPALDWWRGFGSRELTLLMEEAQTANLDIAAAV